MRNGGTQRKAKEEQGRMTVDQIIEERRKREAKERGEGKGYGRQNIINIIEKLSKKSYQNT